MGEMGLWTCKLIGKGGFLQRTPCVGSRRRGCAAEVGSGEAARGGRGDRQHGAPGEKTRADPNQPGFDRGESRSEQKLGWFLFDLVHLHQLI